MSGHHFTSVISSPLFAPNPIQYQPMMAQSPLLDMTSQLAQLATAHHNGAHKSTKNAKNFSNVHNSHNKDIISLRTPSPTSPDSPIDVCGRFSGVVKTFYAERGYGWMSCPRAGRDVFVHANDLITPESRNLLPFLPGTTLEFDIAQRPRGLSAINVVVLSVPQPAAAIPEGQAEKVRRHRQVNEKFVPSRPIAMGRRFTGTVVHYMSSKGFGFVQTSNLAGKVYVHIYAVEKYNVTELRPGMVLEFSVRENHKGKYACNVKLIQDVHTEAVMEEIKTPTAAVSMWEGRHRGILKSFDTKRSLGWIQYHNTEVFMHIYEIRQDNAEDRLHLGVELEFSIGTHGRGPTAYDIDIIGAPTATTLQSIPMTQLMKIPMPTTYSTSDSSHSHSDSISSDEEGTITPPPEPYSSSASSHAEYGQTQSPVATLQGASYANNLVDGLSRLGLVQQAAGVGQRPKVSLTTVTLLAQLLEASGVDTIVDANIFGMLAQNQQVQEEDYNARLAADVSRFVDETSIGESDPCWFKPELTFDWQPSV